MNIFESILAPFVFVIREVFLLAYDLTGNYGVSVIILSFVISLILLPVFILIEKAKKKNDAVKRKMQPLMDEIKRCYSGQERYYYIRTLHRQHGFSPFKSLVPILSLLLQIPFFIAAYQFLEHFEPLAGESFLVIDDLSEPDRLLGSVNLLPLLMTLVNVITAIFYTRFGGKAERRQMLVVAGVFLVLLYNFPSALVLYWTMNNVFSFLRLFITNPEVFKNPAVTGQKTGDIIYRLKDSITVMQPRLIRIFTGVVMVMVLFLLDRAFNEGFSDLLRGIIYSILSGLGLVVLLAFLAITHRVNLPDRRFTGKVIQKELMPAFMPVLMIITSILVLSQLNRALNNNFNDFALRLVMSVIAGGVITGILALLVFYLQGKVSVKPLNIRTNVTKMAPRYMILFWSILAVGVFTQISWALEYNFRDIVFRLVIVALISWLVTIFAHRMAGSSAREIVQGLRKTVTNLNLPPWLYNSMLFVTAWFYLGAKFYYGGINRELEIIAVVVMMISQIAGMIHIMNNYRSLKRVWRVIASVLLTLVVLIQIFIAIVVITDRDITILNIQLSGTESRMIDLVLPGLAFIFIIALLISGRRDKKVAVPHKTGGPVFILSLLYLLGFIFLWSPLAVYASYPSSFDFAGLDILRNHFLIFAIPLVLLSFLYYILPRGARQILAIVMITIVILGFIHNTIAPIQVGTLQDAVFLRQDNLAQPLSLYILEALGIPAIFFFVRWLIHRGYHKQILYVLIAMNLIMVTQSLIAAGNSGSFLRKENPPTDPSASINFSKDQENIVLLILDMFHGWYVNRAMEENPGLKNIYDGFVWYPNTLAVSNITGSSIGPMLGGTQYTPDRLNQDEDQNLEQKITHIASVFNRKIREKGYRYSGNHIIYSVDDSLTYDTYLPKWHKDWNNKNARLNIGVEKEMGFTLLWNNALFYTAPLVIKPGIYNEGTWFHGNIQIHENTHKTQPYHFLRLLPHISNADSKSPNFVYLYSPATHHPWDTMDESGNLHPNVSPYENNKWALETLTAWIEWMKENGVYDNTKIIIASDHGPHWWFYEDDVDTDIPITPNTEVKKINEHAMGLFSLLMVKDFENTGELEEDWRFMSNADISSIIFGEDDPTKAELSVDRTLPSSTVLWERKLWERNQLRIIKQFEVTGNMYDLNNWKIVD